MELKAAACTWQIICLVLFIAQPAESINCYICGPGANSAFQAASISPSEAIRGTRSCEDFDHSDDKASFAMTCPPAYLGCITQIEGSVVRRTCESHQMDSCATIANSQYCLCKTDLCNSDPISPVNSSIAEESEDGSWVDEEENYGEGDDEDYAERGSGHSASPSSTVESEMTTKGSGLTDRIELPESTTTSDLWLETTTKGLQEQVLISPKTSGSESYLGTNSLFTALLLLLSQFAVFAF